MKRAGDQPVANRNRVSAVRHYLMAFIIIPLILSCVTLCFLAGGSALGESELPGEENHGGNRAGSDGEEVSFSNEGITPGSGSGGTTFLFTVTVRSSGKAIPTVEIVINEESHAMQEINPEDGIYSDGKDFYYREKLDPGGVVYFYRSGNATTSARSLTVGETRMSQYHYDVALIMGLFVIPVIIMVVIFRRIVAEVEIISKLLPERGIKPVGPIQRK